LIVFLIWIIFFDDLSLVDRSRQMSKLRQLENDKLYYQQKIEEDTRKLQELEGNEQSLEKFAREQYLMKKPGEDVYVFRPKQQTPQE
jgi:cell division protein FtsB